MKTLYFNRNTLLNESKNTINIPINVSDDFSLRKEVEEVDCYEQECNELDEPLFLKDIYVTESKDIVIGKEETTEITDNKVMVETHLKNDDGNFIYLENIYEHDVLVGTIETTEPISEREEENTPLFVSIHKCNDDGELLYLKEEIIDGEVFYEETTEDITEDGQKNEPIMIEYPKVSYSGEPLYIEKVYKDNVLVGQKAVTREESECGEINTPLLGMVQKRDEDDVPLYYIDITDTIEVESFSHTEKTTEETDSPVMIPKMKTVTKDVFIDEGYFHIDEVAVNVIQELVEVTQKDYMIAEMLLHESEWDLENSFANTGLGIVNLPVGGYIKSKEIELEVPTTELTIKEFIDSKSTIEVTINDTVVGDDGVARFKDTVDNIVVVIKNVSGKPVDIKPYHILY